MCKNSRCLPGGMSTVSKMGDVRRENVQGDCLLADLWAYDFVRLCTFTLLILSTCHVLFVHRINSANFCRCYLIYSLAD